MSQLVKVWTVKVNKPLSIVLKEYIKEGWTVQSVTPLYYNSGILESALIILTD
jgi:hypothetical protein